MSGRNLRARQNILKVLDLSRTFCNVPEFSRIFQNVLEGFRLFLENSKMFQNCSNNFQNCLESIEWLRVFQNGLPN